MHLLSGDTPVDSRALLAAPSRLPARPPLSARAIPESPRTRNTGCSRPQSVCDRRPVDGGRAKLGLNSETNLILLGETTRLFAPRLIVDESSSPARGNSIDVRR